MAIPALLATLVKRRVALRLAGGAAGGLALGCVMAFCGSLALIGVGTQATAAACSTTAVNGTSAAVGDPAEAPS